LQSLKQHKSIDNCIDIMLMKGTLPKKTAHSGHFSAHKTLQCSVTIAAIREPRSDLGLAWSCAATCTNVANE
jgi:hypothetical protein